MTWLLRPLCWLVGHLWETEDEWPKPIVWVCVRCGRLMLVQPKEW
jgi:hypothetical protein